MATPIPANSAAFELTEVLAATQGQLHEQHGSLYTEFEGISTDL